MNHLTLTQLSVALDDQHTGALAEQVRRHLGICPQCRDWRDRLTREGELLRELLLREPDEDFFDELFDGIEAAVRSDGIEAGGDGPRAVTLKRSLLGLVGRGEPAPKRPSREIPAPRREPASGATPWPDGSAPQSASGSGPTPAGAAPQPASGMGPQPATSPAPQRQTPRPEPASGETPRPSPDAIERPPVMQVPGNVKPSSAEIVRPGPPLFVPPAPSSRTPAERGAVPDEPPAAPGPPEVAPPVRHVEPRPLSRVDIAPQWHSETDAADRLPFEPLAPGASLHASPSARPAPAGPPSSATRRPSGVTPAPSAATRRPSGVAPAPSAAARRPSGISAAPVIESEPAPPPRGAPERTGIRVTHVELVVVLLSLLVLAAAGWLLVQAGRMRAAEQARRLSEPAVSAPVTPRTESPAIEAHVPPEKPARTRKVTTGAAPKPSTPRAEAAAKPRGAARIERPATTPDETRPGRDGATREAPAAPVAAEPVAPPPVTPAPAAASPATTAPADEATWPLLCGQVVDEQGQPVAGARVLLADLDLGARTDRRGRFCLSAPPGDRTLSVVALGFHTLRQPLHVSDAPAELSLTLKGTP